MSPGATVGDHAAMGQILAQEAQADLRGLRGLVTEQQTRTIQLERQVERLSQRVEVLLKALGREPDPLRAGTSQALFRLQGHVEAAQLVLVALSDDLQGLGRVFQGGPEDDEATEEEG